MSNAAPVFTMLKLYLQNALIPVVQAEELMRKIEKEEEHVAYEQPDKKTYHLCIVNLVIGSFPSLLSILWISS